MFVASTRLGDHQGIPSTPANSLYELHMARYQIIITIINTITVEFQADKKRLRKQVS